jgi:hypothetical protein
MLKKLFNDLRNASICPALEVPVEVRTHIANECLALATELRTCQPNEATGQPNFEKSIERAVEMLNELGTVLQSAMVYLPLIRHKDSNE